MALGGAAVPAPGGPARRSPLEVPFTRTCYPFRREVVRSGMAIFRAYGNATGLSRQAGDPVTAPDGLPDHRVEIHVFRNGDAASAFVDGLALAGNPNKLAFDHEHGSEDDNRTVLVARLDEPRPPGTSLADCLPVIRHEALDLDHRARQEAMRRIVARRDEGARVQAGRTQGLREAFAAAGLAFQDAHGGWVRTDLATFQPTDKGIEAEFRDAEDHGDPPVIRERAEAAAREAGFRPLPGHGEYEGGPYADPAAAVAAQVAFAGLCEAIVAIRKEEYQRAFMARMRATPSRRRFLAAAAEEGLAIWNHRGNLQGTAGGVTVKATEFLALERAGWIRRIDRTRAEVTPEGRAVAGIDGPAPAP